MDWNFKLRGEEVSFTIVNTAVAVRPSEGLRARATRPQMVRRFGGAPRDDTHGGSFGLDLPVRNRALFERAGWLFVEPQAAVADAAEARGTVDDAEAVRPVLISPSGALMIGTDLVTAQLPEELPEEEAVRRLEEDGLTLVRRLLFAPNTFEAALPAGVPLPEIINDLQAREDRYRFVEPSLLQVITGRRRPTDPGYGNQWQHNNDGSNGGTPQADIRSEGAWALTRGVGPQRPMRVAVIDNSMQVGHTDLRDGITGGGFFEPDGRGGATFVRLRDGAARFPNTDSNHGTFCLGMVGARVDNDRGGCGSAPESDLIAIACMSDQVGTQTTLARAVAYAADPSREDAQATPADGADVISCSLGPNDADWILESVLDLALGFAATRGRGGRGAPIFWAVSNGNSEIARDQVCSHPRVLAVGRSNRNDRQDGSAFGPKLEFLAPGREVFSTLSANRHGFDTGTSYATPLAAGVGALVLSRRPDFTAEQVRDRLRRTCDKIGGVQYDANGHHIRYGFGRINAEAAVR